MRQPASRPDPRALPGELVPNTFSGKVASVHRGIVNIEVRDDHEQPYFVSLVTDPRDRSALTVLLLETAEDVLPGSLPGGIAPGARVTGTPEGITVEAFGSIVYDEREPRYTGKLPLDRLDPVQLIDPDRLRRPVRALRDTSVLHRGLVPVIVSRTAFSEDPFVVRAREELSHVSAGMSATGSLDLSRLVGLGPGFTPAGDDFVAGALLGEHLAISAQERNPTLIRPPALDRPAIVASLHRTTTGGATLLMLALKDRPPFFVHEICATLSMQGDLPAIAGRVGHSSGLDFFTGFLWYTLYVRETDRGVFP